MWRLAAVALRLIWLVDWVVAVLRRRERWGFEEWLFEQELAAWVDSGGVIEQPWLCCCGHRQEDGLHCDECGIEPPWGCDCGLCDQRSAELEFIEVQDEFLDDWMNYPGDLLAGDVDFKG